MIDRFLGDGNRQIRIYELQRQTIVKNELAIARELEEVATFQAVPAGQTIIEQNHSDRDVYFIISGEFDVIQNAHKIINVRKAGDHVGEMSALDSRLSRSATIRAKTDSIVAKVKGEDFKRVLNTHASVMYPPITETLCNRLFSRSKDIAPKREIPRVFVIGTAEGTEISDKVVKAMASDDLQVTPWNDPDFFRAGDLTLDRLEQSLELFDFAIAIVTSDDITISRGAASYSVRDNVMFELGLFMGQLGRQRTLILRPPDPKNRDFTLLNKSTSDLSGLGEIRYKNDDELIEKLEATAKRFKRAGCLHRLLRD